MPAQYAFHGTHHPGLGVTNYLAVVGPETAWPGATPLTSSQVKDGRSNTILIVENRGAGIQWLQPRDLKYADMSFQLNSAAGISSRYVDPAVVMLDGTVVRLSKDLSPATLRALLTANGGETLTMNESGWVLLPDGRQREPAAP
jgi:hypothetical protein